VDCALIVNLLQPQGFAGGRRKILLRPDSTITSPLLSTAKPCGSFNPEARIFVAPLEGLLLTTPVRCPTTGSGQQIRTIFP
jgi:hypothetical protein